MQESEFNRAKEVVVALVRRVLPASVVDASDEEARMLEKTDENTPPMVEEAVTKSEPLVVALVRERLRAVTRPVLEMEKSVEVEKVLVDELMEKRVVGVVPTVEEAAKMERKAAGEEVPMPTKPAAVMVVVEVPPK